MVAMSQQITDNIAQERPNKPTTCEIFTLQIPVIDLADHSDARNLIVEACKEFGFFKVINHGVPTELMSMLEEELFNFFKLPQQEKDKCGPANPFGYGNKRIGLNGDVGWIEYLLFCTNPEIISQNPEAVVPKISESLSVLVNEYISEVRNMACNVLEMMVDEMKIEPRDVLSKLIRDDNSDSCFRFNHYPPACSDHQMGIGEHTDPQIISVGRSNNTSGLQISLRSDGSWVSVPPDDTSFFFNVGDSLQVMSNGRFKSVKHRVIADGASSRVSMIFFGGPPLSEKIKPLQSIMEEGEESLYKEFTWFEYKNSAYKTRLGDDRLGLFEKSASQ
uniref:gibberellin 2beta-dioxygenase n=1 Tax=Torenia fournieri TaxID=68875 RepID=E7FLV4_9LAMI|nr:gibberellin 2-oxidase [Torenia fournieri]BAJ76665.1 gibberellin 2-oxidase [Torenia fournieri]